MRLHDIGLPLWTSLALVFALTTGGPFPWFLFYCLAGALVLSGLWAYHASRNVDCSATVDRAAATAGEVVELRLELENRSLLPVPRVLVANGAARPEDGEGTGTGDGAAAGQRVTYLGLARWPPSSTAAASGWIAGAGTALAPSSWKPRIPWASSASAGWSMPSRSSRSTRDRHPCGSCPSCRGNPSAASRRASGRGRTLRA